MTVAWRNVALFALVFALIVLTGIGQSWNTALFILHMGLISAVMSLGVNMQWGYAGLFNVGVMGFVARGGLAAVLVSMPPTGEAWSAGGPQIIFALLVGLAVIAVAVRLWSRMAPGRSRSIAMSLCLVVGFFLFRALYDGAVGAFEATDRGGAVEPDQQAVALGAGLGQVVQVPIVEQVKTTIGKHESFARPAPHRALGHCLRPVHYLCFNL